MANAAITPTDLVFVVLPLALAGALTWGVARVWSRRGAVLVAVVAAAWMTLTWTLAARGVLLDFSRLPPPFVLLFAAILSLAASLGLSPLGLRLATGIPLWVQVGVQGFRLPLELAMHDLAARGIMPDQMSYSGRNFDVVTGATAIVVAAAVRAGLGGRRLVAAWNALGLLLLVNILVVAIASTPVFAWFGPERLNVFAMTVPYVWLPAVMVLAALSGHLLIGRALAASRAPHDAGGGPRR